MTLREANDDGMRYSLSRLTVSSREHVCCAKTFLLSLKLIFCYQKLFMPCSILHDILVFCVCSFHSIYDVFSLALVGGLPLLYQF
jgi:hypothetical protein